MHLVFGKLSMSARTRFFADSAVLCLLLASSGLGCGGPKIKNKKPTFQVAGRLMVRSQPAEGAMVILRPPPGVDTPEEWTMGFPRARVKADGSFVVETYGTEDGAPVGEYVVLVNWPVPSAPGSGDDATGPDRLEGRFSDPANSPLRAKIEAKQNILPAFELN